MTELGAMNIWSLEKNNSPVEIIVEYFYMTGKEVCVCVMF